jgi:xylose isomerase
MENRIRRTIKKSGMILTGEKEYYKGVGAIKYEGKESDNPLAFKYYDPERQVLGKPMREHFKFAVAYWHSFWDTTISLG